jgi:D-3-phosphoglycerate dehydrogenase
MPDILITENLRGTSVDDLSSRFDVTSLPKLWKEPAELLKWTGNFRAIIVRNRTQIKAALLNAGKKLVLGRAGDLGNVDVTAATRAGILVTSIPDQNAISVAELAMGLMLSLARMIPVANQDTEDGNWRRQ